MDIGPGDHVEYIGGVCPDAVAPEHCAIGSIWTIHEIEPADGAHCDGYVFEEDEDDDYVACACCFRKYRADGFLGACVDALRQAAPARREKQTEAA